MKLSISFLLTWICLFVLLTPVSVLKAEGQEIKIDLELVNKNTAIYGFSEAIKVNVRAVCLNAHEIHINQGFSYRNLLLKMRVIDPTGSLVFPKRLKQNDPYHNLPHLSYGFYDDPTDSKPGVHVRFAPCEPFKNIDEKVDIRRLFNLELPGYYSAQLKTSAMIFKNGTCNVDAAPQVGLLKPWVGLLRSNTISFCVAGRNKVTVSENVWRKSWTKNNPNITVKFIIPYENGRKKADYRTDSIYLNCKAKLEKAELTKTNIIASLKGSECVESLGGDVKTKKRYLIAITGWLKSGQPFGGHVEISLRD